MDPEDGDDELMSLKKSKKSQGKGVESRGGRAARERQEARKVLDEFESMSAIEIISQLSSEDLRLIAIKAMKLQVGEMAAFNTGKQLEDFVRLTN